MNKKMIRLFGLLIVMVFVNTISINAINRPKFALVIGNNEYETSQRLTNAVNDARDMEKALKRLGFDVRCLVNGTQSQMETALKELSEKLKSSTDAIGLFYFSGHGYQNSGVNYLIPSKADITNENSVKNMAFSAQDALERMSGARNKVNIMILDACRSNPFKWIKGTSGGLVKMPNYMGSIVVYATRPGSTASDGGAANGVYTGALLKNIEEQNLDFTEIISRTANMVIAQTKDSQHPTHDTDYYGKILLSDSTNPSASDSQVKLDVIQKPEGWRAWQNKTGLVLYYIPFGRFWPAGYTIPPVILKIMPGEHIWDENGDSGDSVIGVYGSLRPGDHGVLFDVERSGKELTRENLWDLLKTARYWNPDGSIMRIVSGRNGVCVDMTGNLRSCFFVKEGEPESAIINAAIHKLFETSAVSTLMFEESTDSCIPEINH